MSGRFAEFIGPLSCVHAFLAGMFVGVFAAGSQGYKGPRLTMYQ